MPYHGEYEIVLDTDCVAFGGDGVITKKLIKTQSKPMHGFMQSAEFTLPALSVMYLKLKRKLKAKAPSMNTKSTARSDIQ